jgi:hypothetical protein
MGLSFIMLMQISWSEDGSNLMDPNILKVGFANYKLAVLLLK